MSKTKELKERCTSYREHLKKVFKYLCKDPVIRTQCADILRSCSDSADILDVAGKVHKSWIVSTDPNWILSIDDNDICGYKGVTELLIGGHIEVNEGLLVNQSIAVCLIFTPKEDIEEPEDCTSEIVKAGQPIIIRRFHFDYDPKYDPELKINDRSRSHLQYGGKFKPEILANLHKTKEGISYRLFKGLKKPRIPFPPYDLVLTFDLFLRQFNTPISAIVEDATWRGFVIKSEELWLKGYYQTVNEFLNGTRHSPTLHERMCRPVDWS